MPGEVVECMKCRNQMRWGYSSRAIEFALTKRPNAAKEEIIEDFFRFNPGILKQKPVRCSQCQAESGLLKVVHEYE